MRQRKKAVVAQVAGRPLQYRIIRIAMTVVLIAARLTAFTAISFFKLKSAVFTLRIFYFFIAIFLSDNLLIFQSR